LKAKGHSFAQVDQWKLSDLLNCTWKHNCQYPNAKIETIYLAGSLAQMSREWVKEPLTNGWKFATFYVHKHRAPVYYNTVVGVDNPEPLNKIAVKLISHREGWFPDCEDQVTACEAWKALREKWKSETDIPLLSTPSKTGQALLWEHLPKGHQFPALPAEVEKVIRANSTQHRKEDFAAYDWLSDDDELYQYDGRWMYAALATLDRLPVGEPVELLPGEGFKEFQPGWYYAAVVIPNDWNHIGLLPMLTNDGWEWPARAGGQFEGWFCEPELTLAMQNGWHIAVTMGWKFAKGCPLREWAKKLIKMRERLEHSETGFHFGGGELVNHFSYARMAPRQILNHTIGSLYARGYEREEFVGDDNWMKWLIKHPDIVERQDVERAEGGYIVPCYVPDSSLLSINMPHWAATTWSLERAFVAKAALKCDGKDGRPGPEVLVKINGDAIYATKELPIKDNGNLGQLRRKV